MPGVRWLILCLFLDRKVSQNRYVAVSLEFVLQKLLENRSSSLSQCMSLIARQGPSNVDLKNIFSSRKGPTKPGPLNRLQHFRRHHSFPHCWSSTAVFGRSCHQRVWLGKHTFIQRIPTNVCHAQVVHTVGGEILLIASRSHWVKSVASESPLVEHVEPNMKATSVALSLAPWHKDRHSMNKQPDYWGSPSHQPQLWLKCWR